jgi:CheY-like chemotaxis protein
MKTILVVDDEFAIADAVSSLLGDEGYRVFTAFNGRQALASIAETRPDLILLDFMMPILDAGGVLKILKLDPLYRDIPVILMSGVPESSASQHCSGYSAFLRKPFNAAALLDLIARLLANEKF